MTDEVAVVNSHNSRTRSDLTSRFHDNAGNTLDYVYELEGDTVTIWGGQKGSPPSTRHLQRRRTTLLREWVYPGGCRRCLRSLSSRAWCSAAVA